MRRAAVILVIVLLVGAPVGRAGAAVPEFSDVPPEHQFYDDIMWMATEGVAEGFPDGTYRPTVPVSRQAMAAFMHRLSDVLGGPSDSAPASFSDVPVGHQFYDDISWMAHHGIAEGFPDGTYRPTAPVSRQGMAAFMHRLSDLLGGPTDTAPVTFVDVESSNLFFDDIAWMNHQGVTQGYPDNTFRPTLPVSRQSMAAFMHRLADVLGGSDSVCLTQTQLPVRECRALQALFEDTNGPFGWHDPGSWLVTEQPCAWGGVACDYFTGAGGGSAEPGFHVTALYLAENNLMGPIPTELRNLTELGILDLFGNEITGQIPVEVAQLPWLYDLDLDGNQLTGAIPPELAGLQDLRWLHLGDNAFTGSVPPELGDLDSLETLSLYGNELSGPIPAELGDAGMLSALDLDGNQLTGPIPPALGQLYLLQWLSLDANQLTGPIPAELGNLSHLRWLSLDHNQLSGSVPSELMDLSQLVTLRLHANGCLTAADPGLAAWLTAFDPAWSDGCP